MNYYNEIDPFAAAWLRELIKAGHIPPGDVDERDIRDVLPSDLTSYTQCHFFAGIGGWSYALRLAGWPDSRPVWTGSCPCQPFSAAGKRGGIADERHLWPALYHLVSVARPETFFGEQVASKDGLAWLDTVYSDLEGAGYAVASADLCAAGFGAPHIRQRLYFVADSDRDGRSRYLHYDTAKRGSNTGLDSRDGCGIDGMADSQHSKRRPERQEDGDAYGRDGLGRSSNISGSLDYAADSRRNDSGQRDGGSSLLSARPEQPSLTNGFWRYTDWIPCRDEKYRPVEPGTFPLAHGIANRVGKLRGYGNAIVAPVAAAFIASYMDIVPAL